MKTTTKQNFHYNNEALFRLAKIYLSKYGYDLNQFYSVGTSSGTFTMQGYVENNPKLLLTPGEKNADGSTIQFNVGKYLRVVLSMRGF
jgi:hypothetical protein